MLVEIALSLLVVGLTLSSIMEMFITASRSSERQENLSVSLNIAQERMEEIKHLVYKGEEISVGTEENLADDFLPVLLNVSVDSYLLGTFLTESNYYQFYGTPASLSYLSPPRRVDRITQVEWVDDAGGTTQDYKKVTVTIFWPEDNQTKSVALTTYIRKNI